MMKTRVCYQRFDSTNLLALSIWLRTLRQQAQRLEEICDNTVDSRATFDVFGGARRVLDRDELEIYFPDLRVVVTIVLVVSGSHDTMI